MRMPNTLSAMSHCARNLTQMTVYVGVVAFASATAFCSDVVLLIIVCVACQTCASCYSVYCVQSACELGTHPVCLSGCM